MPNPLLAIMGRKEKFPDPASSVGEHLQTIGAEQAVHIWDAIGPAHAAYKQIVTEIKAHLDKFGASVYGEVRYTCCMVGKSKDKAKPTIIFHSPERIPRQLTRAEVKASGILAKYPGFRTADSNRPPGFMDQATLKGKSDTDLSNISAYRTYDEASDLLLLGNIEGAKLVISTGQGASLKTRTGTIGGILYSNDRYYIMTAAHVFPEFEHSIFQQPTSPDSALEFELDSDNESDVTEPMDIEITSSASITDSDDSKSNKSKQPSSLIRSQSSSNSITETEASAAFHPMLNSDMVPTSTAGRRRISPQLSGQEFTMTIVQYNGQFQVLDKDSEVKSSIDSSRPLLDYAIVEISHSNLYQIINGGYEDINQVMQLSIHKGHYEYENSAAADIYVKTNSGGIIHGSLLAAPTYMRAKQGRVSQELWVVNLESKTVTGDCGCWVCDTGTRKVLGHLVAGSSTNGFAYIVPMYEVIDDLKMRYPGDWQLSKPLLERKENLASRSSTAMPENKVALSDKRKEQQHKGKSVDLSSFWSEWIWTNGDADSPSGFWYASRYNTQGNLEYDYRYPDTTQSAESLQGTQNVPRSPDFNIISERSDSVFPGFLQPVGTYTTAASTSGPSNSGTFGHSSNRHILDSAYFSSYINTEQPPSQESSGYPYANTHSQASGFISPAFTAKPNVYTAPVIPPPPIQDFSDLSITTQYPPKPHDEFNSSDTSYGGNTGSYNDSISIDISRPYARYEVFEGKSRRSFWKVGRVFATLWTEPAQDQNASSEQIQTVWLGSKAFSEIRRFVVLHNSHGNSICCPIHSYNNRATLKRDLPDVQQHVIIYTSSKPPDEYWYKNDDGSKVYENLSKEPIKVKRETAYVEGDLGTSSRLNYSRLYTVEHHSRVFNIGIVEESSMAALHKSSFVRRDEPIEKPRQRHEQSSRKGHRRG